MIVVLLSSSGYIRPLEDAVATALAPFQYSLTWASSRIRDTLEFFSSVSALRTRVAELEATVDRLLIENVNLREADIERANLRELLRFKQANPTYEILAAEVIGHDSSNLLHYIMVDRGADDGLAVGMPVVTARGLVGRITSVYPTSARVMLLTDSSSMVNALIQRSRSPGVIQGQGRVGLAMLYVSQSEDVQVGDIVLTSGLGGNFPRRLVIGEVISAERSDVELFQQVQVRSAVDFDRLEVVLIVLSFTAIDAAP